MKIKLVIIVGPTAAGKSQFALELAQRIAAEIVVADSMQVYRYLDIGTAKPTAEERALVPHHLIDIVDPDEEFSAGRFRTLAHAAISAIHERQRNVIVCGGTGLYSRALMGGLCSGSKGSKALRETLRSLEAEHGEGYLYETLREVDPASAERIHPHDLFRIVRCLEVYQVTGVPLRRHHEQHGFKERAYDALQIGIETERSVLYDRINQRCDTMMTDGFLEEVKSLLARGFHPGLRSMQSLGYRHLCGYLAGHTSLDDAVKIMKRDTRRYAKRQLTWFRADPRIAWMREPLKNVSDVESLVNTFFASP